MVANILLLNFTITTITILIFVIWSSSNGYAYGFDDCSSNWSCGNVSNIGFPFMWPGRHPHCGHPKLQLQCIHDETMDYTLLQIFGDDGNEIADFRFLGVWNTDSKFLTIKLLQVNPNNFCPVDFIKFNVLDNYLFNYTSNVSLISFSECPDPSHNNNKLLSGSIACFDLGGQSMITYYWLNQSDFQSFDRHGNKSCDTFQAPVLKEELNKLKHENETLGDVLDKGFEVELDIRYLKACVKCLNSGGHCGSMSSDQHVCYCKDDHPSDVCPKSVSSVGKWKLKLALGLGISGWFCILVALIIALCCYFKKSKLQPPVIISRSFSDYHTTSDLESGCSFFGIPVFSYNELKEVTNNFDSAQELGDGGFGVVYYGKLRDGREVAVKRLYEKNYKRVGQFINEVDILTKLRHQNLVTLYGCTSRHSRELLLVYEYIPNGTVADHLYGEKSRPGTPPWNIRMNIAIQTANALSYLHASDIIHRDVKTNNILVDNNFAVKVADFGLSRLFPCDATHISTAPHGTPGYLDPEYHKLYQVSDKSDVYSFGVVLIELVSSLPAIDMCRDKDEINLSEYAMNRIQKGEIDALIDTNLGFKSDFKVKRMTTLVTELAFRCLQQEKEIRPSMEEVFEDLKQIESVDYEALESEVGENQVNNIHLHHTL